VTYLIAPPFESESETLNRAPEAAVRYPALQARIERLLTRLRLAVVFGGDKAVDGAVIVPTHNPRAWKSYEAVAVDIAEALRRIGFAHVELMPDDMRLAERLRRGAIDLAWLNTGGVQGLDPMCHAPALLEMLGVPYVGHDPLTVSSLDNKHVFKRALACLGIPTAPFMTWSFARGPFRPAANRRFAETFAGHRGAFVVKPVAGRASLNVHYVADRAGLAEAVAKVWAATESEALIEAFLPGREFCVAVGGPVIARRRELARLREPFVFAAVERLLAPDEPIAVSQDIQPITGSRLRLVDPMADRAVAEALTALARAVYREFELGVAVRIDARADAAGRIAVLEANPKPDLKRPAAERTSIVCYGLAASGMDYEDLVLSQLASRIDHLTTFRRRAVPRLAALLSEEPGQPL
jgi:D-alanine-D-alanine ligase